MEMFEKFAEIPMGTWIALGLIVVFGVVLMCFTTKVVCRVCL